MRDFRDVRNVIIIVGVQKLLYSLNLSVRNVNIGDNIFRDFFIPFSKHFFKVFNLICIGERIIGIFQ